MRNSWNSGQYKDPKKSRSYFAVKMTEAIITVSLNNEEVFFLILVDDGAEGILARPGGATSICKERQFWQFMMLQMVEKRLLTHSVWNGIRKGLKFWMVESEVYRLWVQIQLWIKCLTPWLTFEEMTFHNLVQNMINIWKFKFFVYHHIKSY